MKPLCGLEDCDCEYTIEQLRNDAFKDRLTVEKLRDLVKEFAAHPCVDCVGCSTEAERRMMAKP